MKALLQAVKEPKSFIMTMNAGAIPTNHWTQDNAVGGGRIIGEACHFIDLMRFLAGSPIVSVQARRMGDVPGVLVTGHRRESLGGGFESICGAINRLTQTFPEVGVLYPVHLNPQVQEPVRRLLGDNPRVALVGPAGYEDFIWLLDRCTFALSDSGGVQEEAPSLGKPVLVMRDTTERPEGVAAGTCTLVGTDPDRILAESRRLLTDPAAYARRAALENPYGDGRAADRIRAVLERDLAIHA